MSVKPRYDGAGDEWAEKHRKELGEEYYLMDMDLMAGVWVHRTEDALFLEHQPDSYKNRNNAVRSFAYVALFDRKKSWNGIGRCLSSQLYMDQARKLSVGQPKPCRFFQVVDGTPATETTAAEPYVAIEYDIYTGKKVGQYDIGNMQDLWKALGLDVLRNELRQWLETKK